MKWNFLFQNNIYESHLYEVCLWLLYIFNFLMHSKKNYNISFELNLPSILKITYQKTSVWTLKGLIIFKYFISYIFKYFQISLKWHLMSRQDNGKFSHIFSFLEILLMKKEVYLTIKSIALWKLMWCKKISESTIGNLKKEANQRMKWKKEKSRYVTGRGFELWEIFLIFPNSPVFIVTLGVYLQ